MNIVIIFAGGVGQRMSRKGVPKQFILVNEVPIIIHTLRAFENHPDIDQIYISVLDSYREYMADLAQRYGIGKLRRIVPGGATGQDSIYNALKVAAGEHSADATVLIHDGVRPIVSAALISDCLHAVEQYGSAVPYSPCTETVITSRDGVHIDGVLRREHLYKAQAPQGFPLGKMLDAHERVRCESSGYEGMVDSASVFYHMYGSVHLVRGSSSNIKITNPEDVFILKGLLEYRDAAEAFGLDF
ncbi:MAG: 2-C-methyl-D-erythritol 4-phosphate cytidylyltransferase [Akkermansia sp.]